MKKQSAKHAGNYPSIPSNTLAELDEQVLDWMASLGKNYQMDLRLGAAA